MRKLALIIFLSVVFFQLSVASSRASFGVAPADITFENLRPGMTIEKEFLVSRTDLEREVRVVIEPNVEGINEWVRVDPSMAFTIPSGERAKEMIITISVPENAPLRNYDGYILVKEVTGERDSGVSVVKGVGIAVDLVTSNIDVDKLLVRSLEIPDFSEVDPLRLLLRIENQGNRLAAPDRVEVIVSDISGQELFRAEDRELQDIEPSITTEIESSFEHQLSQGEYLADVNVFFQDSPIREDRLVFSVNEADNQAIVENPSDEASFNSKIIIPVVVIVIVGFLLFLLRIILMKL